MERGTSASSAFSSGGRQSHSLNQRQKESGRFDEPNSNEKRKVDVFESAREPPHQRGVDGARARLADSRRLRQSAELPLSHRQMISAGVESASG